MAERQSDLAIYLIAVFILGIITGSFLNVCIYRIPAKKSIIFPPSSCPKCKKIIKWYDNIPLLSYMILGGKCRHCHKTIAITYPIVEILTGIIFIIFFLKFGLEKIYFYYIIVTSYMIILALIDINRKIVPDGITIVLLLTGFLFGIYGIRQDVAVFDGIIGALTGGLIIYFLNFFSNGKIGEGDIKLMAALGFLCGAKDIIYIIFLSFIIGAVVSLIMLALKKYGRKDEIAFVPFIAIAFMIKGLLS